MPNKFDFSSSPNPGWEMSGAGPLDVFPQNVWAVVIEEPCKCVANALSNRHSFFQGRSIPVKQAQTLDGPDICTAPFSAN
jgi:hypothetical protein